MATLGKLYSFVIAAAKRHVVVLGGIVGTAAAAALVPYITNLLTSGGTLLSEKARETACQYRQQPVANDSRFVILVSRLTRDPDRSHTDRVMQAFQNEHGFQAIPICESLSLDYSKDSQNIPAAAKQRAEELIKANHADLLLFGDVTEQNKAIMIYAVNENGGCDLQPKPTEIKLGVLPSEFTAAEKEELIEVSLDEIQKACLNQAARDWPAFAKRMNKMETFFKYFDFSQPKSLYFASSYIEAMRLLYWNGQGDVWFSKGEGFAKGVIDKAQGKRQGKDQGTNEALSSIYAEYTVLLDARFDKTHDKNDQDAAFGAVDKAISLNPKNAYAYHNRGVLYSEKGNWDRAIDDFTQAMALDPEYGRTYCYCHRGFAYLKKGNWDRAIDDFTKAVAVDPKNAPAYHNRGLAYANKSEWDPAIDDYTKAIGIDPKDADAYEERGDAYAKKGDRDRAVVDYNKAVDLYGQAIQLNAKSAPLWNSRCWARAIIGQLPEALSDCNQSLDIQPNDANTRDSRGFVYLKMGKLEDAIADYNIALGLNSSLATSLHGRGVAKLKKGDVVSGNSDIESAKRIEPDIADKFQRYGIELKQTSQSPPRSRTSRARRFRQ